MNETSPIRTETAREFPVAAPVVAPRRGRGLLWFIVFAAIAGVAWYGYKTYYVPKTQTAGDSAPARGKGRGGRMGDQPQAVGVARIVSGDIPVVLSGLGTVTPLATVTVRSQISGYLTEIGYREGQMVKKGDFLAQIDPRIYEAQLAQFQGQLQRDQALLQNSKLDLARFQRLAQQDSISKQNVDTQAALVKQNEGTVAADQALVDQQKLNIAYTRITSPVDGRVGLRQIDQGNYITAASTNIVVVTQIHPISVVFTLPEDDVSRVMKRVRSGAKLAVKAYDRGDTVEVASGVLDTVDNQIDNTTGTVKLRALFQNEDDSLFPQQFVNAKLTVDTLANVPIVPTSAILRGTPGTYIYLLDGEDKVVVRPIKLGETDGPRTAILSGLSVGDRVVVDGTDRLRDGAPVRVIEDGKVGASKPDDAQPGTPGSEGAAAATGATMPAAQGQPPGEPSRRERRRREQATP